jgi:hypothetical protein
MRHKQVFLIAILFALSAALNAAAAGDDAAWLREKGTLIFHDAFEREETGNLAKAIGNGWNSATADRVPYRHLKSTLLTHASS